MARRPETRLIAEAGSQIKHYQRRWISSSGLCGAAKVVAADVVAFSQVFAFFEFEAARFLGEPKRVDSSRDLGSG